MTGVFFTCRIARRDDDKRIFYIISQKGDVDDVIAQRKSLTIQSNAKRWIVSASASFAKLWRSSAGSSVRPPTTGAASTPDARLLFAMINAVMLSTAEIGAIVVVVLTTIVVATIAVPPTERQSATIANARLAMGIALATISLESRSPRLAVKKTATSVPWYVVLQEAMTTKVDFNEGCEIAPRNNQYFSLHCKDASN